MNLYPNNIRHEVNNMWRVTFEMPLPVPVGRQRVDRVEHGSVGAHDARVSGNGTDTERHTSCSRDNCETINHQ